MAIKVNGTTVINDSRALTNIASVDATTAASITAAGVGGTPAAGTLGGPVSIEYQDPTKIDGISGHSMDVNSSRTLFFGTTQDVGFIATHRQIYRTTDGGATYTRLLDYDGQNNTQMVFNFEESPCAWDDNGTILYSNGDYYGGVMRSTNSGASWSVTQPFGATGPGQKAPWALGNNTFMIGKDGSSGGATGTWRSTDAGASWSYAGSIYFNHGYTSTNGTTIAIAATNGVMRSTNARTGFTWATVIGINGLNLNQSITTNNNGIWVIGDGRFSTDDGLTWSAFSNYNGQLHSLRYINGYFTNVSNSTVNYTTNPANGWTLQSFSGSSATPSIGKLGSTTQGYNVAGATKQLSLAYSTGNQAVMTTTAMTFA